jgi:tripartite-type tricarboxylate transporter receptor subunit TctC
MRNQASSMKQSLRLGAAAMATALLAVAAAWLPAAQAADYPSKPIRMIVGQPPGGPTDLAARVLADGLQGALGQPVIVENRPGAAGQIGLQAAASAQADGYTLCFTGASLVSVPAMSKSYPIDTLRDFTMISQIVGLATAIFVSPRMGVNTLDEFIADLKKNPGKRFYGNMGAGDFLTMSKFEKAAGIDWEVVRFNGAAPAFQALFAGDVQFSYTTVGALKPYADAGKIKLLAVSGTKRSSLAPEVPAIGESSIAAVRDLATGTMSGSWFALVGPAGMPKNVVDTVYSAVQKLSKNPDYARAMGKFGLEPVGSSPDEFREQVKRELEAWAQVVKELNYQPQ